MKEIDIKQLKLNPFTSLGNSWFLITSGDEKDFNTMTASWGHLGSLWGTGANAKYTAIVYVRPQRYTRKYMDNNELFTITVFPPQYKKDLAYLGSHSGKDENKIAKTAVTPIHHDNTTSFKEASLTFVCKKIYQQTIKEENFKDSTIVDKTYPLKDFHDLYVGEIIKVYIADDQEADNLNI